MATVRKLPRFGAVAALAFSAVMLASSGVAQHAGDALLFRSAKLQRSEEMPLEGDGRITIHAPNGDLVEVPASVVVSDYECDLVRSASSAELRAVAGAQLKCYQIVARGDTRYTWAMWRWGFPRLSHFRVLKGIGKNPYLAWSEGREGRFVELSGHRDPVETLGAFLGGGETEGVRVPAMKLVPEGRWGVNALFFDILVESVGSAEGGQTVVRVKDGESGRLYAFVFDGKEWRRRD